MLPSRHSVGGSPHSGGGSSTSQFIGSQSGGVPVVPSGHIHYSYNCRNQDNDTDIPEVEDGGEFFG
jgi:hypothetical protein